MRNSEIEDIVIDNSSRAQKKNGGKYFFIIFFLIVIAIISFFAYKYFIKKPTSNKEIFFSSIYNTNISKILDNNIYSNIYKRILTENSEISNNITFSSSNENNNFQGFDVSKFNLKLLTNIDIQNIKSSTKLDISYSDNDLLQINCLFDQDKFGLFSDEIVNKYVGLSYEKIEDILGIKYNKNPIKELKNFERIDLTSEEVKNYISKYISKIANSIPEEKFSMQDNIAINKNSQNVSVIAYTLTLSQEELKDVLINFLTELKNDEELLEKIVPETKTMEIQVRTKNMNDPQYATEESTEGSAEEIINENAVLVNENGEIISDVVEEQVLTATETILPENTTLSIEDINSLENIDLKELIATYDGEYKEKYSFISSIAKLMLGNKLNSTIRDVQGNIDKVIDRIDKLEGEGLKVTIYVSEETVEKIIATLPNKSDVDIEFTKSSGEENGVKLTYLYSNDNKGFEFSDNKEKVYLATDGFENNSPEGENNNGFSIELNRVNQDASNLVKIVYSFIEDKKINKKININLKTTGNSNSKTITNDFIVMVNSEEENKIVLGNTINFSGDFVTTELNNENCLLVNELSEEDLNSIIKAIWKQTKLVVDSKKTDINLIDSNIQKFVIRQNSGESSSNLTHDEAKNMLIEKVSQMMGEAANRNEEFTIQNLLDLKIDGYDVSTSVNENAAIVVIDVYTFSIDSDFTLTDVN